MFFRLKMEALYGAYNKGINLKTLSQKIQKSKIKRHLEYFGKMFLNSSPFFVKHYEALP